MRLRWLSVVLMLVMIPVVSVNAQTTTAEITSPPPVSLLRGTVPIVGTANDPNQTGYFIQYRELDTDFNPIGGEAALWSPAVTLQNRRVVGDVLGEWDTTAVDDGIYQLQLVINRTGAGQLRVTVEPLRVENTSLPFAGARFFASGGTELTPTATPPLVQLTPAATPTVSVTATSQTAGVGTVTITATVEANVRLGDSTSYPPVGFLRVGESAPVLGKSNRSTWLYVELPNGRRGFVSPSTLNVTGDPNTLPLIDPPPLPFTPTPVPTATFTPLPVLANLQIVDIDLDPDDPVCGETFIIEAIVQNVGTGPTNSSGIINVVDRELDGDDITETTIGGFPILQAGERFEARIPITVDEEENDDHRIELIVDANNEVLETDEGDNFATKEYELEGSDECD